MSIRINGTGADFEIKPGNKTDINPTQKQEAILNMPKTSGGYEVEKAQGGVPKTSEPKNDKAVDTTARTLDEQENAVVFERSLDIKDLMNQGELSLDDKRILYSYFEQIRDIRLSNLNEKRLNNSERAVAEALTARQAGYDENDPVSVENYRNKFKKEYNELTPKEKEIYRKALDETPLIAYRGDKVTPEMIQYAVKYANGDYNCNGVDELDNFIDERIATLTEQSLFEKQPEIDNNFKAVIDEKVRIMDFTQKNDTLINNRNERHRKVAAAQRRVRSEAALSDYETLMGKKSAERMKKASESSDSAKAAKRFKEKGYW